MIKFLQKNLGIFTVIIMALVPIVLWAFAMPLGPRFFGLNTATTSIGQLAGLLGMTLFSINLILSSKLKILDKYFFGLNNVYLYHRAIGSIAFSLLLFHPLFLVVKYFTISLKSAALFFVPFQNTAIDFGIIALLCMMALIVATFYIKIRYQYWKISHKFMVAAFVFAVLHVITIPSDISREALLRAYVLGIAGVGLALGFYQAFVSKYIHKNFEYIIKRVTRLTQNIIEIEAEPKNMAMSFVPGQFAFFRFGDKKIGAEIHPFSIASGQGEQNLKIVIKALGDFTIDLKNVTPESPLFINGPFGVFSYQNIPNKNQIWIAGGAGITPFLSMARSLCGNSYIIDLYYCTKTPDEAVLLHELLGLTQNNKNFKVIPWPSDEKGRIDAQIISSTSNGLEEKDILLCGPASFMENLKKQFLQLKIPEKKIHWEYFKLL